jgi:branched-chain amino acid transport system substrate-binding protein
MPTRVRVALGLLGLALLIPTLIGTQCRGAGDDEEKAALALASPRCLPLEYEGDGDPDYLIASELTPAGPSRRASLQIVEAIRYELEQRDWRAGEHRIAFQACSDAKAGTWDSAACRANAQAFADDERLLGVVGPYYSGCAKQIIPSLNTALRGPIPIVSPLNVDVCLTEASPACDRTEPDKYYPSGTRNYLRLAPNEIYQAAALARFARDRGIERVYVLSDREAYGVGIARHFSKAARALGLRVVGTASWNPNAPSYAALFRDVARSDADATFLGGVARQDGARLIREKVAVLGSNRAKVKLLAPDGFAEQSLLEEAGPAARGLYVASAGVSLDHFPPAGRALATRLSAERLGGGAVDPYALHGAEAARALLDAIARSDGSRRRVLGQLFRTKVKDGLLGSYAFDRRGDPFPASGAVVSFTVYRAGQRFVPVTTLSPAPSLIAAARG